MSNENKGPLTGVALIAALVVIAAWMVMLLWLTQQTGATEIVWSRLLVVLGSLQAVAFAGAGALFGTQVQRQRVQDAEKRADKADERSVAQASAAEKGRTLARTIKDKLAPRVRETGVERTSVAPGQSENDLLILAQTLFPDA